MTVHIQSVDKVKFGDDGYLELAASGEIARAGILSFNGTNIVPADADAIATYAHFIALREGKGSTGDPDHGSARVQVARRARLYDDAAGFTANAPIYLSGTAGEYTQTRPTGVGDLAQVIGWAFSTSEAEIWIKPPTEVTIAGDIVVMGATAARLENDTGPAAGVTLAAANDYVTYAFMIPQNAVGLVGVGRFLYGGDVTLDASDTVTITVASAQSGEANDEDTDSITATGLSVTADDVASFSIATGINAAGLVKPGGVLFVKILKAAEGTAGDDPIIFGCTIDFTVV